jgi:translation initiation factor 5
MASSEVCFVVNIGARANVKARDVNINGSDDPFYRYKMPQLQTQVVGQGKMIKTFFVNLKEVAAKLCVLPQYLVAYFAYDIGSSFGYDASRPERERGHITGQYSVAELAPVLRKFISQVVICSECSLPELSMAVVRRGKSSGSIHLRCHSCGRRSELVKGGPKFHRYILNCVERPPKRDTSTQKGSGKDKKQKKRGENGSTPEERAAVKAARRAARLERRRLENEAAAKALANNDSELVWHTDISDSAVQERKAAMATNVVEALVTGTKSTETDVVDAPSAFRAFLEAEERSADAILAEIARVRNEEDFPDAVATPVLANVLLPKNGKVLPVLRSHKKVFARLLATESTQVAMLHYLEGWLQKQQLVKQTARVIKCFYDQDLIEEEAILAWDLTAPLIEAVRVKAAPLVAWLKEADEESD